MDSADGSEQEKRGRILLQRFFENTINREEAVELLDFWNALPEEEAAAKRHFLVDRSLCLLRDRETTLTAEQFEQLRSLARSRFGAGVVEAGSITSAAVPSFLKRFGRFKSWTATISVASLSLFLLVGGIIFRNDFIRRSNVDVPFAAASDRVGTILEKSEEGICVWGEHSDGRQPDGSVVPGEIELCVGIAQIYFNNGAVVTFEGPTRMTIHSNERCVLHAGRLYARIAPEAVGFTVETPIAEIKDLGTEFGVEIRDGEKAEVQVFSGRVDVLPKDQNEFIPIMTGGWLQFGTETGVPLKPHRDIFDTDDTTPEHSLHEFTCTTAEGDGRESHILSGGDVGKLKPQLISRSGIFTLLKHSHETMPEWHRKGYFSIDLNRLPDQSYQDVQLELAFAPTGVGFLSFAPKISTFSVYGLTDESLDHWSEETLSWENAPANLPDATGIDMSKAMKIGTFEIPREEEACRKIVKTEQLRKFLASDTNRIATFMIVRETAESAQMGYAHGFANRHHPELAPPTLRFFYKPKAEQHR